VADAVPAGVALTIPKVVEQRRPFLRRDLALTKRPLPGHAILDLFVNSLIFVPFALLACLVLDGRGWQPKRALIAAIGATAVFSLGVESAQYFMVSRSSEMQDLFLNVLSGGIGGLVYLARRRRSGRSSV
jgi:glycopeptide antibiotics resistance protein